MNIFDIINDTNMEKIIYALILLSIVIVIVVGIYMYFRIGELDSKPTLLVIKSSLIMKPSQMIWS